MSNEKLVNRRSVLGVMAVVPIATALSQALPATASTLTYYVDPNGNDDNNGTSISSAWATLAKVNSVTFQSGDSVLFRAGSVFSGQLVPQTNAVANAPVIFGKFGSGSKPIIMGDGTGRRSMYSGPIESVVYIYNTQNIELQSLAITSARTDASTYRCAVYVRNNDYGVLTHVAVKDCEIYGIRSVIDGNDGRFFGGIFINQYSTSDTASFDGLVLTQNYIHDCDMAGIYIQAYDESRGAWDHPNTAKSTNVTVSNNTIATVGGDGIVVNFTASAVVDHNVASDVTTHNVAPFAGIWTACSDDIKIEYNEVYGTNISQDGMAFDDDLFTNRSIFQYNYSHDNAGGFFQSMRSGKDYIVRYNVSQNDSTRIFRRPYVGKHYNNVIYLDSGYETPITADSIEVNSEFYNNIVYVTGKTSYLVGGVWISNNFYGAHPSTEPDDPAKIVADPQVVNPGGARVGIGTAVAYKLTATSPVINHGRDVAYSGPGVLDFFGNEILRGTHNIGIDEYYASGSMVGLVVNPGFEVDCATLTPSGWSVYTGTGSTHASYTEGNNGAHTGFYHLTHFSGASTWNVYTYQTISGLSTGTYTLSAWVQRHGGGFKSCELEAKNYGGSLISATIPDTSSWQQVEVPSIQVVNGQIEIGFWTDVTNGDGTSYVYIDDVVLRKDS